AIEEALGLAHQVAVVVKRDQPDARRRAAAHLVQHAWPRSRGVDIVGAGAEQERLLQRVERLVDRAGRGERSKILPLDLLCAAVLERLWRLVIFADQDVRKGFVIAQNDVEARLEALDEVSLEQ